MNIVENANKKTAADKTYGNHEMTLPMAAEVRAPPWFEAMNSALFGSEYAPVRMMTKAVMVHTTIVSMKGSSRATIPSSTGCETFAAE